MMSGQAVGMRAALGCNELEERERERKRENSCFVKGQVDVLRVCEVISMTL